MRNYALLLTALILCLFPLSSSSQMSSKSFQARKLPTIPPSPSPTPTISPSPTPTISPAPTPTPTPAPTLTSKGEVDCPYFVDTKFSKNHLMDANELQRWKNCIKDLDIDIPDPNDGTTTVDKALSTLKDNYKISTSDEVDTQLITAHYLSRQLKRWGQPCSSSKTGSDAKTGSGCPDKEVPDNLTRLDRIERSINKFMDFTGLSDPFAGSLVAGPVFGDTGKLSSGTTSTSSSVAIRAAATSVTGGTAASSQSNTKALAHVEWGSKHFGKEWSHFDFSFGGSFGLQPALSLLTNPPPSATGTPTPSPHQLPLIAPQHLSFSQHLFGL